jgi:RNA polymerase sigma-70 factor (ECF subfamily)
VHTPVVLRAPNDEEDFRALYAAEYAAVAGYCWTLTHDRELAHDLAQEAFTRLLTRWVKVDDPGAYVFRIATNLIRRNWRSRSRHDSAVLQLAREPAFADPDQADITGVRSAVLALPRRLRDVVMLHYFADMSVAEVASALHRPDGTIKRQLSEARALLAGALEVPGA